MGSCVGTLYWKGDRDAFFLNKLGKIAEKNGVTASPEYPAMKFEGYNNDFTVVMEGLTLSWYGRDECITRIDNFLIEAQSFLDRYGMKTKIHNVLLPM